MNYKFILLIFSSLLIFGCDDEQAAGPGDADTYIKFFGASNADIAYMARQTPDGGCVLLGTTEIDNEGEAVFKIKVIKVDGNGNEQWQKVYPEFSEDKSDFTVSLKGRSVIVVDDGYIIVGDSIKSDLTTNSSLLVMKINDNATDNSFTDLSINYYDNSGAMPGLDLHGIDVIQDSDDNFRIISNVMNDDELIGIWFSQVNTDLSFDIEGNDPNCYYDLPGKVELVKSLSETSDNNFFFGGTNKSSSIDNSTIRQVDKCFNGLIGVPSNIVQGATNPYTASQIIPTNIGYALVGTTLTGTGRTKVFLSLLNSNGTPRTVEPLIYSDPDDLYDGIGRATGNTVADESGSTIANTSDGGFIIGGATLSETAGEEDILLIKTDANGGILWSKTIGNANQEIATHIQQAADGGFLIFGNTEFGGIDTMVLIKTDKNGNIN